MALDNAYPTPASMLTTMAQWEALFALMGSGVILGVGNEFTPTLNSPGRQVVIDTGSAALRGFITNGSTTTATTAPTASGSPRIDRLVLRLDRTAVTAANWIKPVIIAGTPAGSNPAAPAISASLTGSWDLPICQYRANPDGSLSNLVDERYWLAGPTTKMTSPSRPSASPPRMGIEADTHRLLWADGTTWLGITQDTGWVDLSLSSGFTQGSYSLATRIFNGVGYVTGTIVAPNAIGSDLAIAVLPPAMKPPKSQQFMVYQDGGTLMLATAYATSGRAGQLWLTGNTSALAVGASLRMSASWPI